jgi:hypothetical protein
VVGGRDAKDRALSALGPGLDRSAAPEVRHRVLMLLAGLPEGAAPSAGSVLARLRWERPPRGPQRPDEHDLRGRLAEWTLSEAELLGITGRGALSAHGRALLGAPPATAAATAAQETAGRETATPDSAGRETATPRGTGRETATSRTTGRKAPAPGAGSVMSGPGDKLPVHKHQRSVGAVRPGETTKAAETAEATDAAQTAETAETAGRTAQPLSPAEQAAATAAAARLLAPLLPEPLDHVLLQADLTAVATGPLRRPLAAVLDVLADVESKGGATVYRFTPASVRRALDAGRSAADLHAFLAAHSRTPVPQPLAYLIDDVARRHGHLRVGAASAYVRCDDDALLTEILADKRSTALRLRRLAPTVLATPADPAVLLEGLRAMGYAPAAESAEGDVLIARSDSRRTPPRTAPEPVPDGPPVPDATLLSAAVRAIRAGDLAATTPRKPADDPPTDGELPRTGSAETLATVQAAVLTGEALWIGYVNAEGAASQRVIAPVRVEGGFVTAYDHTADEVRTYPLHRITGVAELAQDRP